MVAGLARRDLFCPPLAGRRDAPGDPREHGLPLLPEDARSTWLGRLGPFGQEIAAWRSAAPPGGSAQALLERGLHVVGIDPSEMHPGVLQHPHFVHVRKRGADVRRRELHGFKWLLVDSNVAPQHTLDIVEAMVTHPATSFQGLLLTLKLPDWQLAAEIADYARRVRSGAFSRCAVGNWPTSDRRSVWPRCATARCAACRALSPTETSARGTGSRIGDWGTIG